MPEVKQDRNFEHLLPKTALPDDYSESYKHRNPFSPMMHCDWKTFLDKIYRDMGINVQLPGKMRGRGAKKKGTLVPVDKTPPKTVSRSPDVQQKEAKVTSPLSQIMHLVGLTERKPKKKKKKLEYNKWIFIPKTRKARWPGVQLPPSHNKHISKKKLLMNRTVCIWNVVNKIRKKIEEREIAEADMDLEPEPFIDEPETEDEEEPPPEYHKLKNLWWKMSPDEDLPIDVALADRYVRKSTKLNANAPIHIQKELQQSKDFQDYLDNNGVSQLIIGILIMMYTKPCYPEGAKEMLRLGLGGKPMEVATAADVLKEIDSAQERINELEGDLNDYRIQVLRLLKEDLYEEPEDPTTIKTPKRRMEYVLKAFNCRSRPNDVPFESIYDLSEIPGLAKYNVKLPKEYEAFGREMTGAATAKVDAGVNTKKWIYVTNPRAPSPGSEGTTLVHHSSVVTNQSEGVVQNI